MENHKLNDLIQDRRNILTMQSNPPHASSAQAHHTIFALNISNSLQAPHQLNLAHAIPQTQALITANQNQHLILQQQKLKIQGFNQEMLLKQEQAKALKNKNNELTYADPHLVKLEKAQGKKESRQGQIQQVNQVVLYGQKAITTFNSASQIQPRDQNGNLYSSAGQLIFARGNIPQNNSGSTQILTNSNSYRSGQTQIQSMIIQPAIQPPLQYIKGSLMSGKVNSPPEKRENLKTILGSQGGSISDKVTSNNQSLLNIQSGLFPRISNLRNEASLIFKNSGNIQIQQQQQQKGSNEKLLNEVRQTIKTQASPRNIANLMGQGQLVHEINVISGAKVMVDKMHTSKLNQIERIHQNMQDIISSKEVYTKSLVEQGQNYRQRLRSNHTNHGEYDNNFDGNSQAPANEINSCPNEIEESFKNENQFYYKTTQGKQYFFSEKKGKFQPSLEKPSSQVFPSEIERDSFHQKPPESISAAIQSGILSCYEMSPQILTKQINQRQAHSKLAPTSGIPSAQSNKFFGKRTGSKPECGLQVQLQVQYGANSFAEYDQVGLSPLNSIQQQQRAFESNNNNTPLKLLLQQNSDYYYPQSFDNRTQSLKIIKSQKSNNSSQSKIKVLDHHIPQPDTILNSNQSQILCDDQQSIKIPVICGFHKRIILLTTTSASSSNGFLLADNGQVQSRRMRNKNPNCNHNNNFVFYQPIYNNVKYDDTYKKKEEIMKKVFFNECLKEDDSKKTIGMLGLSQIPSKKQTHDPTLHLKVIENALTAALFQDLEVSSALKQIQKGSADKDRQKGSKLLLELGLDKAIGAHKAFLVALIRSGKILADNMFKILHEFKQSALDFDNECIYCKYSSYALKESLKISSTSFVKSEKEQLLSKDMSMSQHIADLKLDNLIKMFQNQLFRKSFINTSLMIIQRKINEKILSKQQKVSNALVLQKEPNNKNIPKKLPLGQEIVMQKKQPQVNQQPTGATSQLSLEQLGFQLSKLSKCLANPKDKEKFLEVKEKYYREFLQKINVSNGIIINFPKQSFAPYKYYIGKGNNSILVRNAIKQRFWWSMGDFEGWDEYNFIWTQWKSNKIIAKIKTNQEASAMNEGGVKTQLTGKEGQSDSLLSTQMTVTDRDSNSSVDTLIQTPTRRKRSSTLTVSVNNSQTNNLIKKSIGSNQASNSAFKNGFTKQQQPSEVETKERKETSHQLLTYNHMENNFHLSNKKAIYYNMKVYYEAIGIDWFSVLPLTFHIKEGPNDKEFLKFQEVYKGNDNDQYGSFDKLGKSIWIVKPGENTNRGCGIQVCKELQQIRDIVQNTNVNGQKRSYIIQKYIEKPLLYKQRKFDIRCYTLLTTVNGNLQGYWYNEGYLRTSVKDFNLRNVTNRLIHLTNDAVQKKSDDYGKFESGNKLSYQEFQKYLDSLDIKCNVVKDIVPQLKKIATDTIKAVSRKIDPVRRHNTFEIFGYDFMIDEGMKPWLIEVNTNPCLELSGQYLTRLIPSMIENAVKIAIDPLFPPPPWPAAKRHLIPDCTENKFEIVFNEITDAAELKSLPIDGNMNGIIEEEELEDEGSEVEEEEVV